MSPLLGHWRERLKLDLSEDNRKKTAVAVTVLFHLFVVWSFLPVAAPDLNLSQGQGGIAIRFVSVSTQKSTERKVVQRSVDPRPQTEEKKRPVIEEKTEPKQEFQEPVSQSSEVETQEAVAQPLQGAESPTPVDPGPGDILGPRDIKILYAPAPKYPGYCRMMGQQGTVWLIVSVGSDGHVNHLELEKSSRFERLDRSAMDAVRKWRFDTASYNSFRKQLKVRIPVRFELNE